MNRVLRSATPKIDVVNEPQKKSLKSTAANPQKRRRAAAVLKENKENVTKQSRSNKIGRKQPLQQNNSAVISKKNDRTSKSTATAKPEKLHLENVSTNVSEKKNRTKSVVNVKRIEENIADTTTSTATKKIIVVSSVKTRKKQSKDIQPVESAAKNARSPASPAKRTLRQRDPQKATVKSTATKNQEVSSIVRTRSGTRPGAVVSSKGRTRRQLVDQPTLVVINLSRPEEILILKRHQQQQMTIRKRRSR